MNRRGFFAAALAMATPPDPPEAPLQIAPAYCPECLLMLWIPMPAARKIDVACSCGWAGEIRLG
jgi:hypothetical protein